MRAREPERVVAAAGAEEAGENCVGDDVRPVKASEPNCIPRPEEKGAFQDRRFIFEEIGSATT